MVPRPGGFVSRAQRCPGLNFWLVPLWTLTRNLRKIIVLGIGELMAEKTTIRETENDEIPKILAVYPLAFPDEELRPLVSKLLEGEADVLSLSAFRQDALIGHVLFTIFSGEGENDDRAGALLGPLCVLRENQNQGGGTALVRNGFERLDSMGIRQVFVLGDPSYYGRFGFQSERRVLPPYTLPEEWTGAWQSLLLSEATPLAAGQCLLPDTWMQRALWAP